MHEILAYKKAAAPDQHLFALWTTGIFTEPEGVPHVHVAQTDLAPDSLRLFQFLQRGRWDIGHTIGGEEAADVPGNHR